MRNSKIEMELLQPTYATGGSLKREAYQAFCNANRLLNSSRLCNNIQHVHYILILSNEYRKHIKHQSLRDSEILIGAFKAALEYYQHTVDELIIIAAFENYAKGELLLKQFIPHEIKSPEKLRKTQKSLPVHTRTYRAQSASISTNTISTSTLLKATYRTHLNLSVNTLNELSELNKTRNLAHFQLISIYGLSLQTVDAIQELKEKITARTNQKHLWTSLTKAKKRNFVKTSKACSHFANAFNASLIPSLTPTSTGSAFSAAAASFSL